MKKRLVIVGGGISGLTSGIYAAQSGLDVDIYESHSLAGGECTGWMRKGSYIEGCAHWIIGMNPKSEMYPLWRNVHAITDDTVLYPCDYLSAFDVKGKIFYLYSDLKKLEKEMISFFPEDHHLIHKLIRGSRAYTHIRIPVRVPLDQMNIFMLAGFGLNMTPALYHYTKYTRISVKEFASKAKNPEVKDILLRWLDGRYNQHSYFYIAQAAALNNASVIQGGSVKMIERMVKRFQEVGGHLHLSSPVKRILIQKGQAIGVELKSGEKIEADDVVCSTDAHYAFSSLLEGKYQDSYYDSRFANRKDNPLIQGMLASFRVKKDVSKQPKMLDFVTDISWEGCHFTHIPVRNFSFDPTLDPEKRGTLLTCLFPAEENLYGHLKAMDKESYQKAKEAFLHKVAREIEKEYHLDEGDVEELDLTTPLTYERYCNAYEGSYMSFLTTKHAKGLMRTEVVKGIKHFFLCGQWIMPPGGLPVALFTGKHAAWRVCKAEKIKFQQESES